MKMHVFINAAFKMRNSIIIIMGHELSHVIQVEPKSIKSYRKVNSIDSKCRYDEQIWFNALYPMFVA